MWTNHVRNTGRNKQTCNALSKTKQGEDIACEKKKVRVNSATKKKNREVYKISNIPTCDKQDSLRRNKCYVYK